VFFPRRVGTGGNRSSSFVQLTRRTSAENGGSSNASEENATQKGTNVSSSTAPSVSFSLRAEASRRSQFATVLITAIVAKLEGPTNPTLLSIAIEVCPWSSHRRQVPGEYGEDVDVSSARRPLGQLPQRRSRTIYTWRGSTIVQLRSFEWLMPNANFRSYARSAGYC
jgi:hypothetical protein